MKVVSLPKRWNADGWVLLSLLVLVSLTVSQSIYEMLAQNQEFLAIRRVGVGHLLAVIAVFNWLPALLAFLAWKLIPKSKTGVARSFLGLCYMLLFALFFLQVHKSYLDQYEFSPAVALLWVIPAGLLAFVGLRFEKAFRTFVLILSPVLLLFPAWFLARTWPQSPAPVAGVSVREAHPQKLDRVLPPVYVLVFDELSLHALLDSDGQIDAERFPNFKTLAGESYWFRNAVSNADFTHRAMPILLTGQYPRDVGPSQENYPNNLLSYLHPVYEVHSYEFMTHFCIRRVFHCPDAELFGGPLDLARDVTMLFAARVLPRGVSLGLPSVERTWGPFRSREEEIRAHINRFNGFLDSLRSHPRRPVFYLFHNWLPHAPYIINAEGKIWEVLPALFHENFVGQTVLLRDTKRRYLMQVEYVDRQLGEFVRRLRELDLYDGAVIVVLSDHGVSWEPQAPGRKLTPANAHLMLRVPLFIKLPLQKEGVVSERDVQLIDIAPTVAEALGLPLPWETVGRSVFAADNSARSIVAFDAAGNRHQFLPQMVLGRAEPDLSEASAIVSSALIGVQVESAHMDPNEKATGGINKSPQVSSVPMNPDEQDSLIYLSGWAARMNPFRVPEHVAIAVNGRIVAVAPTGFPRPDVARALQCEALEDSGWVAYFSSRDLGERVNIVRAYAVFNSTVDKLRLAPLGRPRRHTVIYKTPSGIQTQSPLVGRAEKSFEIFRQVGVTGNLDALSRETVSLVDMSTEPDIEAAGWAAFVDEARIPDEVAVALNGEIVDVVLPCCERRDVADAYKEEKLLMSGWVARVPTAKLRPGENRVTAYAVLDVQKGKLAPLHVSRNIIRVLPQ